MSPTDLLERYVHEVGQHLPGRTRKDIQLELLSLLQDSLEERAANAGQQPTVQMAADLLREFGPPQKIAAEYRPEQYLIGPQLFPTYKVVATIILAVIGGFHAIFLLIALLNGGGDTNPLSVLLGFMRSFAEGALVNLAVMTLVFVLIERFVDLSDMPQKAEKPWDPLSLPPINNPNRVNRVELIGGIVGGLVFIAILNTFGNWSINEQSGLVVYLAPAFLAQIPWLTASIGLEVILKTIVAWQGRWMTWSRLAEIGQSGFGLYVLYRIWQGPVLDIDIFSNTMTKFVLGIIVVIVTIDLLAKVYRFFLGRPTVDTDSLKGQIA